MTDNKGWGCPTCGDKREEWKTTHGVIRTASGHEYFKESKTLVPCPTCLAHEADCQQRVEEMREACARVAQERAMAEWKKYCDTDGKEGLYGADGIGHLIAAAIRSNGGGEEEGK